VKHWLEEREKTTVQPSLEKFVRKIQWPAPSHPLPSASLIAGVDAHNVDPADVMPIASPSSASDSVLSSTTK
jgi:hypothetical protein